MLSPKIKQARRVRRRQNQEAEFEIAVSSDEDSYKNVYQNNSAARSKSMVLGELSRVSRPCSPLDQEKALKAGWLKRQRSIMKNWQLRWFVLRTEALYFYKDQEETKAQGCILLQGSQVNELPATQDEPGRHLFEIVPGASGEKEKPGISHESYLLMANSQSDMEEWVRAIRRAIWAPLGGGIFGQHLEETMLYETQSAQRQVPVLVEQCVSFIREHGLTEEGLFRAPGQTNHVRELQDAFDRGEKPVFDSTTDVHTVASLLKLYIRELPEPVIPFAKYTQFLSCAQLLTKDREMAVVELCKQVKSLPQVNYNLLRYICKFLDEVQSRSNENKMSVQNLATVFGPNVLRPRMEDPVTMMEGSSQVQHLMTVLISEHSRLYQRDQPEPSQPQKTPPVQRGKVEWLAQEDKDNASTSDADSSHEPPQCATNEDSQSEERGKKEPESKVDGKGSDLTVSPSKQSKPLPTWKSPLKAGAASGGPRGKIGGSAGDVPAAVGGNWLMNGLSSLRSHRRTTSSGERLKDSTLSLKDSDEDSRTNSSSLSHKALQIHRLLSLPADTSSLWTSYEISLEEPKGTSKDVKVGQAKDKGTEVKDTETVAETTESATVNEPVAEETDTDKLEAVVRQLEESCSKYQSQVSRLEEELDQEKKKLNMLEIRLRNSERAHQDAEKRNVLLQKEMEDFFKTLGDLTTATVRTT
ncbi:hypothetical protein WMY93_007214 [Mugilogobius chulae]|uniref:Rho GTPase activating protein 22 n=1 Tax=Mugilogobius chulae TaxID=88201 RepID=A0AAW0PXK9_9GOBI